MLTPHPKKIFSFAISFEATQVKCGILCMRLKIKNYWLNTVIWFCFDKAVQWLSLIYRLRSVNVLGSLYFLLKSDVAKCSQPSLLTASYMMDADRREQTPQQILF